jgi:hypothetical protein
MSTRVIASIGVVLCAAMTSFSIYLGVIEHIYTPTPKDSPRLSGHVISSPDGRHFICESVQRSDNTTTTNNALVSRLVPCKGSTRASK